MRWMMGVAAIGVAATAGGMVLGAAAVPDARVVRITAKQFEYDPPQITLKRGETVVLELATSDRSHGFKLIELGIDARVMPGETTAVRVMPDKAGTFIFACDVFCGSGHEEMEGQIVVTE